MPKRSRNLNDYTTHSPCLSPDGNDSEAISSPIDRNINWDNVANQDGYPDYERFRKMEPANQSVVHSLAKHIGNFIARTERMFIAFLY